MPNDNIKDRRICNPLTTTPAAAAATAAVTAIPAATTTAAVACHLRETRVNNLLGLLENIHKVASLLGICDSGVSGSSLMIRRGGGEGCVVKSTVSGEERDGCALGAGTASSTNTMDIILRIVGVVIVDHVSNVAHIFK